MPHEYRPANWLIIKPHRPANTETGVSHRDILYAVVGRVLSAWELLETLLAWEFQRLIGTDRIAALRALGSIASSKARISAIGAAADVQLSGDELVRHKRCMEDVNLLTGVRNMVAHGMVYWLDGERWTSDDTRAETSGPYALGPPHYNTSKFRDGSFYLFSVPQIDEILSEIHKMQARVGAIQFKEYRRYHRVSFRLS